MEDNHDPIPSIIGPYQVKKLIGKGCFSTVYLAIHKMSHRLVSIKAINKQKYTMEGISDRLHQESSLLKQIDHPFIISLYEIIEDSSNLYLIMENLDNGSLSDFIRKNGPLNDNDTQKVFLQLISAVSYLHNTLHIVHRDIKTENIMIDSNMNIRLIDFGFARFVSLPNQFMTTNCGSFAYASPELISRQPYTSASDIWSLGIVIYTITTGFLPFVADNYPKYSELILKSEPKYPSTMNPQLVDLISKMLNKNPKTRITIDEIIQHPFLNKMLQNSNSTFLNALNLNFEKEMKLPFLNPRTDDKTPHSDFLIFDGIQADQQIVKIMNSLHISTLKLNEDLINQKLTPEVTIYKILKREKINEEMNKFNAISKFRALSFSKLAQASQPTVMMPPTNLALIHLSPNSKSQPDKKPLKEEIKPIPLCGCSKQMCMPKIRRRKICFNSNFIQFF